MSDVLEGPRPQLRAGSLGLQTTVTHLDASSESPAWQHTRLKSHTTKSQNSCRATLVGHPSSRLAAEMGCAMLAAQQATLRGLWRVRDDKAEQSGVYFGERRDARTSQTSQQQRPPTNQHLPEILISAITKPVHAHTRPAHVRCRNVVSQLHQAARRITNFHASYTTRLPQTRPLYPEGTDHKVIVADSSSLRGNVCTVSVSSSRTSAPGRIVIFANPSLVQHATYRPGLITRRHCHLSLTSDSVLIAALP